MWIFLRKGRSGQLIALLGVHYEQTSKAPSALEWRPSERVFESQGSCTINICQQCLSPSNASQCAFLFSVFFLWKPTMWAKRRRHSAPRTKASVQALSCHPPQRGDQVNEFVMIRKLAHSSKRWLPRSNDSGPLCLQLFPGVEAHRLSPPRRRCRCTPIHVSVRPTMGASPKVEGVSHIHVSVNFPWPSYRRL